MNCKPGDLAVIVRSRKHENLGKMVRVGALLHQSSTPGATYVWEGRLFEALGGAAWVVDCASGIHDTPSDTISYRRPFADAALRPLRDQKGKDEMLTWAGKPKVREAA